MSIERKRSLKTEERRMVVLTPDEEIILPVKDTTIGFGRNQRTRAGKPAQVVSLHISQTTVNDRVFEVKTMLLTVNRLKKDGTPAQNGEKVFIVPADREDAKWRLAYVFTDEAIDKIYELAATLREEWLSTDWDAQ